MKYIVRFALSISFPIDKSFDNADEAIEWFDAAKRCMYNQTTINVNSRLCINTKYVAYIELIQK